MVGEIFQTGVSAPAWSSATYPTTTTISQILYSSSSNVIGGISTGNSSMLVTDSTGVPSISSSLIGDFNFTSSTAGVTRKLTISNTDNTNTSSIGLLQTTTGGASAGDPFHTFTITGATSFSLGLDNSASDAFVISASTALGTTNVMSVSTAGEINYPLQPAFLAYNSSTRTNKVGNGAGSIYTLGTDALTEIYDQNSDFNTNGTFTAPVTGKYKFDGGVYLVGCTVCTGMAVFINASNRNSSNTFNRAASAADISAYVSVQVDMDAADTCTCTIFSTGEAGATDDIFGDTNLTTWFGGYLIC